MNHRIDAARQWLEAKQVAIYFATVLVALAAAFALNDAQSLEGAINPALAVMLFATFLQVPVASLGQAFRNGRFFAALLVVNFVVVPLIVAVLVQFAPAEPLVRVGLLIVLLCPCIDYVVTFSHLGKADARLLLAATPVLLILQMLLLPVGLNLFLGAEAAALVRPEPFLHAFVWLIAAPLALAVTVQVWASRSPAGARTMAVLSLAPAPATAAVLFIVIAAVTPQLGPAVAAVLQVVPIYAVFAVVTPLAGWAVARQFQNDPAAARAVAFSGATRNSLVVLPLALAIPGAFPIVPAVIISQTLVELVACLIYIRVLPKLR